MYQRLFSEWFGTQYLRWTDTLINVRPCTRVPPIPTNDVPIDLEIRRRQDFLVESNPATKSPQRYGVTHDESVMQYHHTTVMPGSRDVAKCMLEGPLVISDRKDASLASIS